MFFFWTEKIAIQCFYFIESVRFWCVCVCECNIQWFLCCWARFLFILSSLPLLFYILSVALRRSLHVFLRVCHNSFSSTTSYILVAAYSLTADWRSESAHAISNVIMFTFTKRKKDSKEEERRKKEKKKRKKQ